MALQHCQEDDVGLLDGQRGVDAIGKRPSWTGRPLRTIRYQWFRGSSRQARAVERKSRGGWVCYPRRRVSDIQYFGRDRRGGRGRWQGSRCRGISLGSGLWRRRRRTDARVCRDLRREGDRILAGPEGIGAGGHAGERQEGTAQFSHLLTRPLRPTAVASRKKRLGVPATEDSP